MLKPPTRVERFGARPPGQRIGLVGQAGIASGQAVPLVAGRHGTIVLWLCQ
ncbi:hypothetical protein D3C80_1239820 [compost metagenome]